MGGSGESKWQKGLGLMFQDLGLKGLSPIMENQVERTLNMTLNLWLYRAYRAYVTPISYGLTGYTYS